MFLRSNSFEPYDFLDARLAFGRASASSHVELSSNQNPHLSWSDPPAGTRSLTLLCWDSEVPTVGDDVNKEGHSVPLHLPRADFFHWVLVDLDPTLREIAEGGHSHGVTPKGKAPGRSASGGIQGINDYTGWFAGDAAMGGDYAGYDGPCPPWNDERVHAYMFSLYALDVASLGLSGRFSGRDARVAMAGHVLAEARMTGLYTLNPAVGSRIARRAGEMWS